MLDQAFTQRWIDFYPSKDKRTGAYSWGTYDSNPYILTNFTGSYDSLSTLAHELGHSMHSYYSNHHNRPMLAGYQIFVAEVASTVNEILLNTYLLKTNNDPSYRRYILSNLMEEFVGTCYRQPMFAQFEKDLHAWIEERKPISSKTITDRCLELNKAYFGDAVIVNDLQKYGFYYVPHFYYNFYVYKYTLGMSVAISFVKDILNRHPEAYRQFLTKGESESPVDELKNAGVDPLKDEVYDNAFTFFKEIMDEFESLTEQKQSSNKTSSVFTLVFSCRNCCRNSLYFGCRKYRSTDHLDLVCRSCCKNCLYSACRSCMSRRHFLQDVLAQLRFERVDCYLAAEDVETMRMHSCRPLAVQIPYR